MTCIGLALGINDLWTPPALPYGTLHMVAYTHTAFLGFVPSGGRRRALNGVPRCSPHSEFRIRKSAARTVTYSNAS